MPDPHTQSADGLSTPARRAFAVVPSDTAALPTLPKALFVGRAGAVVLRAVDGEADVTVEAQAGQMLPIRASHVRATGTTATGLVALA